MTGSLFFAIIFSILATADESGEPKIPNHIARSLDSCANVAGAEIVNDLVAVKYAGTAPNADRMEARAKKAQELLEQFAKNTTSQIKNIFCNADAVSKNSDEHNYFFKKVDNGKSVFDNEACESRGLDKKYTTDGYEIGMVGLIDPFSILEEKMNNLGHILACERALIDAYSVTPNILATNKIKFHENSDGTLTIELMNDFKDSKCPNPFKISKPLACVLRRHRLIRKTPSGALSLGASPNPIPQAILPDDVVKQKLPVAQ